MLIKVMVKPSYHNEFIVVVSAATAVATTLQKLIVRMMMMMMMMIRAQKSPLKLLKIEYVKVLTLYFCAIAPRPCMSRVLWE